MTVYTVISDTPDLLSGNKTNPQATAMVSVSMQVKNFDADISKLPRDTNRVPPHGFGNEFVPQNSWEWMRSATWHYGVSANDASSTRETRIQLDLCGFVTFYDSSLRSLVNHHHHIAGYGDRHQNGWGFRKGHRLTAISKRDIDTARDWVKQLPMTELRGNKCSEIDWQALTEVILRRHQSRAREILATMRSVANDPAKLQLAIIKVHKLSHAILYPYLEYPSTAGITPAKAKEATLSRCKMLYTQRIDQTTMSEFEVIIKDSIELVMETLCAWEWNVFEMSERYTGDRLDPLRELITDRDSDDDLATEFARHTRATDKLIAWLGWDAWHDCDRKCGFDELCYIPMWPVIYAPGKHQGGFYADDSYIEEEMQDFWKPTCLNRTMFDKWGGRAREPSHQLPDPPGNSNEI